MKKEITDRIRLLGGNVANLKGNSLKEDLCAITFDTALFLKPVDTPGWLRRYRAIEGLGDWWMSIWSCSILTGRRSIRK